MHFLSDASLYIPEYHFYHFFHAKDFFSLPHEGASLIFTFDFYCKACSSMSEICQALA